MVSAADEPFAGLMKGLVQSIIDLNTGIDIGILDLGLGSETLQWLRTHNINVVTPTWPYPFPEQDTTPRYLMAMVNRPLLPSLFPGKDIILWLDADTFVQSDEALRLFLVGAHHGDIAIVPEIDRSYGIHRDGGKYRRHLVETYEMTFGPDFLAGADPPAVFNCGAFAMRRSSPIWQDWDAMVQTTFQRTRYWFAEQTCLNALLYQGRHRIIMLPAICNWIIAWAGALVGDNDTFYVPHLPYEKIGVIHLAGFREKKVVLELLDASGAMRTVRIAYRGGLFD